MSIHKYISLNFVCDTQVHITLQVQLDKCVPKYRERTLGKTCDGIDGNWKYRQPL